MTQLQPANIPKRLVALFIDLGLLTLLGWLICISFGDYLLFLGNFKIIIGILISTAYFTYFHSYLSKGQTVGKKIFNFHVIRLNGNYLSIPEAFLRSITFTIPYCFSNLHSINQEVSISLLQFFSFTIIPASLFFNHSFIVFNSLRQCYHDLLMDTVVTNHLDDNHFETPTIDKRIRFIPFIGLALVLIISIFIFNPFSSQNRTDQDELTRIEKQLTKNRSLHFSKFYYEYNEKTEFSKNLKIECYVPKKEEDISSEVYLLTEEIVPFKEQFKIQNITLSVVKDFNIGIYSSWETLKKNEKLMKFNL